jgi:zinc transport system substrate-binding protein
LYRSNLLRLQEKITNLDSQLRDIVGGLRTDKLLVYHPAWGHFCLDFGLHQIAIENEGKAPGAGSMADLFASLEKGNINFIISSPGADRRLAAMVAKQFRLNLVMINPMDTDWMRMMLVMKQALEKNEK